MNRFVCVLLLIVRPGYSQSQMCPLNIDWSMGNLTHWFAYTGNNGLPVGNGPGAIKMTYDSSAGAPGGTINVQAIPEYQLPFRKRHPGVAAPAYRSFWWFCQPSRISMGINIQIPLSSDRLP